MHETYPGREAPAPPTRPPQLTRAAGGQILPAPQAPTPPAPMGELAWWTPSGVTPYLRPWASWMRELLELNRAAGAAPIEQFFEFPGAPEGLVDETGATGVETEGKLSTRDIVGRLKSLFGFGEEWGEGSTVEDRWQSIVNRVGELTGEDLEAQQLLSQLRYEPNVGWYSVDIPLIQNPQYT